jgi:hypothetical protein
MPESWGTRLYRWGFNLFPAYRGTGAIITYIAHDWREVRVRLPLNLWTRNYHGTLFGGSIYGAIDPIYMIMLIQILGKGFVVWDKTASIQFKKPGRTTLYAHFTIDQAEIDAIHEALKTERSLDRVYHVDLVDKSGVVHATAEKVIYIRREEATTHEQNRPD